MNKGKECIRITNAYVAKQDMILDELSTFDNQKIHILSGDLNARHLNLSSSTNPCKHYNPNGRTLNRFLKNDSITSLISPLEPTYLAGTTIDFTLLTGRQVETSSEIVDTLTSDHFACYIEVNIDSHRRKEYSRKRITIPKKKVDDIRKKMNSWLINYTPTDPEMFYNDLLRNLSLHLPKNKNANYRAKPLTRWYNSDQPLKRMMGKYSRLKQKWRKHQTAQNLHDYKSMNIQVQKMKKDAKERFWIKYLQTIDHTTPISRVARLFNSLQGKKSRPPALIDPKRTANELSDLWAEASSTEHLPIKVHVAVKKRINASTPRVRRAMRKKHVTDDIPFTEYEYSASENNRKSTSPGADGVTYAVIKFLSSLEGNPVLQMFNMIWSSGDIPPSWKVADIIPIPKSRKHGEFRPISLTSCFCKLFERLVLNRLLHFINTHMSLNMYGFIKKKGTHHAINRVLLNIHNHNTIFIDLKGAFDRVHPDVILAELSRHISGTLLRVIKSYLTDRKSRVLCEGEYSDWKSHELGTPQGGVLSPTLFNVIMNVIGKQVIKDTIITLYADDVVIQVHKRTPPQNALNKISALCSSLGLVIAPEKSHILKVRGSSYNPPRIQGHPIKHVSAHKYLGVNINTSKHTEEDRLRAVCVPRLTLLRRISHSCVGSSVPALTLMFRVFIEPIITYSASALIPLTKKKIQKIEVIQNKAIRIILNCPTIANIESARNEIGLVPIEQRINIAAVAQIVRSIRSHDDGIVARALLDTKEYKIGMWAKYVRRLLHSFGLWHELVENRNNNRIQQLSPWDVKPPLISFSSFSEAKADLTSQQLKCEFLERLSDLGEGGLTIYTDGSVQDNDTVGAGIVTYKQQDEQLTTQIRLTDGATILDAELVGIAAGMSIAERYKEDTTIATDSLSALKLIDNASRENNELVNRIMKYMYNITANGKHVNLIYVPSHVGVMGNERADHLAGLAARKEKIDYNIILSMNTIKQIVRSTVNSRYRGRLADRFATERSMQKYHLVTNFARPDYISHAMITRRQQTTFSRLRLGYRYIKEVIPNSYIWNCKVCKTEGGHTLRHYIMECTKIQPFRCDTNDITEQIIHLAEPDRLCKIVKKFPKFALAR